MASAWRRKSAKSFGIDPPAAPAPLPGSHWCADSSALVRAVFTAIDPASAAGIASRSNSVIILSGQGLDGGMVSSMSRGTVSVPMPLDADRR